MKGILLFPFVWTCLFFQEIVIVHEEEEMQFSDFDLGGGGWGLRETFIDFCVNPLAGADLSRGGRDGGPERRDLAGKLPLPSQK